MFKWWLTRKDHSGVLYRLEHLESAPPPADPQDTIRTALSPVDVRIDRLEDQLSQVEDACERLGEQAKKFTFALSEGIERTGSFRAFRAKVTPQ